MSRQALPMLATARITRKRIALATVAAAVLVGAACQGAPLPSEVLPNNAWRTVSAAGGPTYTFRAGQQVELSRAGTTLSGTYQMPTDSTLVLDLMGRIPGVGAGGPTQLTLRYDVRVLPALDGEERIEFRAGSAADTLVRVD